jgi:hypothetical protein
MNWVSGVRPAKDGTVAEDIFERAGGQSFPENRFDPTQHFRLELWVSFTGDLYDRNNFIECFL